MESTNFFITRTALATFCRFLDSAAHSRCILTIQRTANDHNKQYLNREAWLVLRENNYKKRFTGENVKRRFFPLTGFSVMSSTPHAQAETEI